jgi:hypothetical protein
MKRVISFVYFSLAVAGSGTIAAAHDLFPPCWRGQPNTTFQEWGFFASANPTAPDVAANSYGSPSASMAPGPFSDGWFAGWPSSTNVGLWDLGQSGTIQVTIPNRPGASAGSYKYLCVQVAQYIGGTFPNYSTVSITNATYLGGQRQLVEAVPPFGGIYVDQTVWRLAPNPDAEGIIITSPSNGALIDQVAVDTRCVDGFSPAGTPTVGTQTECDNQAVMFYGGGSYTWDLANATGAAGTGWDLLNVTGTGTINVQSSSGSPFTIYVNSPAGGPANFDPSLSYNWTIATTGGGILNFDATKFAINSIGFQGNLNGDGFGVKVVGNNLVLYLTHPPVANNVAYIRPTNMTWKIKISDLITNAAPQDPGGTISFVSAGNGGNGPVTTDSYGYLCYQQSPEQNVQDSFTYTVKDNNNNLQATGTVTLNVVAQQPAQITSIASSSGSVTMHFAGIPNYTYEVQRSADLNFTPPRWSRQLPPLVTGCSVTRRRPPQTLLSIA